MVVDAGDTKTRSAETGWFYAVVKDTLIYCCCSEYSIIQYKYSATRDIAEDQDPLRTGANRGQRRKG